MDPSGASALLKIRVDTDWPCKNAYLKGIVSSWNPVADEKFVHRVEVKASTEINVGRVHYGQMYTIKLLGSCMRGDIETIKKYFQRDVFIGGSGIYTVQRYLEL